MTMPERDQTKGWWLPVALIVILFAVLLVTCRPSHAASYVCFVEVTPQEWMQKTGQHAAASMNWAIGLDETTPMLLTVGDDGKFAILFRGPDGKTCIMAVGDHAVVAPASIPD
jgi:hypothetical protein